VETLILPAAPQYPVLAAAEVKAAMVVVVWANPPVETMAAMVVLLWTTPAVPT
jgi:hypothetical protein